MANRWGKSRNSDRLMFWGSKITADVDCSHEIKRHLLLGRKTITRQHIKKQRVHSLENTLILEGIGGRGEGDIKGWDGWMASPTRWTWVWVNSRRWWWIGRPGVLRFMGSQRVGHDWATELNCLLLSPLLISSAFFIHGFTKLTFQVRMQYCSL